MRTSFLLLITLVAVVGCQQRTAMELLGTWEGRPDTAETRTKREAEQYGGNTADSDTADDETENSTTDWEAYDAVVTLDFQSRSEVTIALSGQDEAVSGTWEMVQSGPVACTIQIKSPTGAEGADELRRYKLELDQRGGELVGFLMSEVGADRGLGLLYFSRAEQ